MGTQINLIAYGPDHDTCLDAVESTFTRMESLVGMLSRHDPASELSQLNRNGIIDRPGKDIREVLLLGKNISRTTDGAFDVTMLPLQELYSLKKSSHPLPSDADLHETLKMVDYTKLAISQDAIQLRKKGMAVTLDGIGKGYIVDQGVAEFKNKGFDSVYVEAGGDLMVTGSKVAGKPWQIGIRNPRTDSPNELIVMGLSNKAVATSGDYMQPFSADLRHHHIIDPRTGISPPELASATVTASSVALADALATAAMVMGPEKSLQTFAALPDCECLLIGKDLNQFKSKGFQA